MSYTIKNVSSRPVHTSTFDAPPVVGERASGCSDGPWYHSTWSGIYEGISPSPFDGQPYHYFRDGEINGAPQAHFGHPVDRAVFDVAAAATAVYEQILEDVNAEDTVYRADRPDPSYDFMLRSFSDLHDFCDANTYLIDVLGEDAPMSTDEDMKLWNDLADAVDALLRETPIKITEE